MWLRQIPIKDGESEIESTISDSKDGNKFKETTMQNRGYIVGDEGSAYGGGVGSI